MTPSARASSSTRTASGPPAASAGAPAKQPRYRFVCQVPEGLYNDERRAAVTAAMISGGGREAAGQVLAERRRQEAELILAAADEQAGRSAV